MDTTTPLLAEELASRRELMDKLDGVEELAAGIKREMAKIDGRIFSLMEEAGQTEDGDKVTAAGLTCSMRHDWRVNYQPDKWPEIIKWAAERGHTDIVQRRLTASRVMELIDEGETLPEGLTPEPYRALAFRRLSK